VEVFGVIRRELRRKLKMILLIVLSFGALC